jgi:hypothetical protein
MNYLATLYFVAELGLPLAVVPCCIFSQQFPERRMRGSGLPPTTFHQFCAYLAEKSDAIRAEHLAFVGKNLVLFTPSQQLPALEETDKSCLPISVANLGPDLGLL